MGLGKTIQTISLLAYLMEKKENQGPHLILAPKACPSPPRPGLDTSLPPHSTEAWLSVWSMCMSCRHNTYQHVVDCASMWSIACAGECVLILIFSSNDGSRLPCCCLDCEWGWRDMSLLSYPTVDASDVRWPVDAPYCMKGAGTLFLSLVGPRGTFVCFTPCGNNLP